MSQPYVDAARRSPAPRWRPAPIANPHVGDVWRSRLPRALKRGAAGYLAVSADLSGHFPIPMTLERLAAHVYPGGRTLSPRQIRRQVRALERIGYLRWEPGAVVSRSRVREYTGIDPGALTPFDPAVLAPKPRPTPRPKADTKADTKADISPGVYVEIDPVKHDRTRDGSRRARATRIADQQKNSTATRGATRDVVAPARRPMGWGITNRDPAAFEAEVAAMTLPGLFATAPLARKLGYGIFDANRRAGRVPPFAAEVQQLAAELRRYRVHINDDHVRAAMSHVYVTRAPSDRATARAADWARRRGRR